MRNNRFKSFIQNNPILGPIAELIYKTIGPFSGSEDYWLKRYEEGGDSGDGSYGNLATFKARVLNEFVAGHHVGSVIEYGCGDGNQLKQAEYPSYTGFDISKKAVAICEKLFYGDKTKQFKLVEDYNGERADLSLSLDVIYHLVEDAVFHAYMERLFDSADRYVIIYSSDTDENPKLRPPHVKHRAFSKWVAANRVEWHLVSEVKNEFFSIKNAPGESFANFYIYERDSKMADS
jgi:hypothetical protein